MGTPCTPRFSRKGQGCIFVYLDCFGFSNAVIDSERKRNATPPFSVDISVLCQLIISKVKKNKNACLVSDSFFLVLKNDGSKRETARGLFLLAQVIFDFLNAGFVFSGAITAGDVYLERGLFLGAPIVEAVSLQEKEHMPKVLISMTNVPAPLQKYVFHQYGKSCFDYISFLIDRPRISNLHSICKVLEFLFQDKVNPALPKKVLRKYRFFFHMLAKNKRICRIHDFSKEQQIISPWL